MWTRLFQLNICKFFSFVFVQQYEHTTFEQIMQIYIYIVKKHLFITFFFFSDKPDKWYAAFEKLTIPKG